MNWGLIFCLYISGRYGICPHENIYIFCMGDHKGRPYGIFKCTWLLTKNFSLNLFQRLLRLHSQNSISTLVVLLIPHAFASWRRRHTRMAFRILTKRSKNKYCKKKRYLNPEAYVFVRWGFQIPFWHRKTQFFIRLVKWLHCWEQ